MSAVDTIVFDVGRVLVRLDFGRLLGFFAAHGVSLDNPDLLMRRIGLREYESGGFDGEELLRRITLQGDGSMPQALLREHWLGVLSPEPAMLDLARALAATHRVFLLSNIGDLHWDHLDEKIGLSRIGHGALPSYRAGACKPDEAIYQRAEQEFDLEPVRTVFIDDLEANVETALRRGWRGIVHEDRERTLAALRELGLPA